MNGLLAVSFYLERSGVVGCFEIVWEAGTCDRSTEFRDLRHDADCR